MNKKALFIFPILLICVNVSAQKAVLGLVKKVGSLIDSMSVRGLDRNYIEAPTKPWQIILRGNMNQSSVSMNTEGSIEGLSYRAKPYLKTTPSQYVGLWCDVHAHADFCQQDQGLRLCDQRRGTDGRPHLLER